MSFASHRVEKLQGTPEDWHDVGTTNDFGVTFQNSWANQGGGAAPAGFYKDPFGQVRLRGVIDSGSTGTVAFTLPKGYRPEYTQNFISYNSNGGPGPGGAAVYIQVQSDGDVVPTFGAGTNAHLNQVMFRADD